MDPNLRLAVERVNAWYLARLRAQFVAQSAEHAPAGNAEASAEPAAASALPFDARTPLDEDVSGSASH